MQGDSDIHRNGKICWVLFFSHVPAIFLSIATYLVKGAVKFMHFFLSTIQYYVWTTNGLILLSRRLACVAWNIVCA